MVSLTIGGSAPIHPRISPPSPNPFKIWQVALEMSSFGDQVKKYFPDGDDGCAFAYLEEEEEDGRPEIIDPFGPLILAVFLGFLALKKLHARGVFVR